MTVLRTPCARLARLGCLGVGFLCLLLLAAPVSAQDLDPRAYAHVPINGTFLIAGSSGFSSHVLTSIWRRPVTALSNVIVRASPCFT